MKGALRNARRAALEALIKIERDRRQADQLMDYSYRTGISGPDRRLFTELVYGVLRHRGRLDWALGQFCRKPLDKLSPTLRNILRLGTYQLLFLDRIPARAAVDETVGLTHRKGAKGLSGFVNAVLRSVDRRLEDISYPDPGTQPIRYLAVFYSHPEWMVKRWLNRYGPEGAEALCKANNEIPPVTLRANTLLTTRAGLETQLKSEGFKVQACTGSPLGLKLKGGAPAESAAYHRGWFYVQDEAAQLVVLALGPRPGETVLDACAAPGGKTTQMAQAMSDRGRIIALEPQAQRLKRIRENCERLGIKTVEYRRGDARDSKVLDGLKFDRILVDAPCSGLGVLRRNPEGKWHKTESLISRYARLQYEILEGVSPHLRQGGVLVYSTCSTEPEENEQVVRRFMKAHPDYQVDDLRDDLPAAASSMITPEGFLFTLFNREAMDGFFAARLVKMKK